MPIGRPPKSIELTVTLRIDTADLERLALAIASHLPQAPAPKPLPVPAPAPARQRPAWEATAVISKRAMLAHCGGFSSGTAWRLIKRGVFPEGIHLGPQTRVWPIRELDQWNAAKARGATDDELRELVKQMYATRKAKG